MPVPLRGPVGRCFEPIKNLAGLGHEQNAFALAVGEVCDLDALGIAITEVDGAAGVRGDLSGEGDSGAWLFLSLAESAQAEHMRGMCQNAPGMMFDFIPVGEEVVTAVVADLFDDPSVGDAELGDVRRVDDELAGIGQYGFELVPVVPGRRSHRDVPQDYRRNRRQHPILEALRLQCRPERATPISSLADGQIDHYEATFRS